MLTLTQDLFLLSLREKKNMVHIPYLASLPFGLAGAMLVELVLSGNIQLDDEKKVIPIGDLTKQASDERLNELLIKIRESSRPRKITHWITSMASKGKKLEKHLLSALISHGVLKEEEKMVFWVIPYTEFSQQDASAKYLLKQQLRDIILGGKSVDQQSVALFSLLKAIDLLDNIFTLDEIKLANSRVNEVIKDEAIGETMIEILDSISTSTIAAVSAATNMV